MKKKYILVIGILSFLYVAYILYFNYLYKNFYKNVTKEIQIEAVVISNSKRDKYYKTYQIKGKNGIFKNKKFILFTNRELDYGNKIILNGIFNEPEEQRNYKGFNYKNYLKTQKIYGSIKSNEISVIEQKGINLFSVFISDVRNRIRATIKKILPEETSGLLIGILLGDKTNINKDIVKYFQKSGLAHILAVSGTHISFIIIGIAYIIKKYNVPRKSGYSITIFVLIFFIFLTGFTPSVIRSCIMAIAIIVSKLIHKKANVIIMLIIPLVITLIINPYLLTNVGLQLSYLGTIGVIFVSPIIQKVLQNFKINIKIAKIISIPISVQILILPIIIINFHTLSFTFLLSNIIVVPILGVLILLSVVTILIAFVWMWGAQQISVIINLQLKFITLIARICGELFNIYIVTPSLLTVVIYYISIIILLYLPNIKRKQNVNTLEIKILNIFSKFSIKTIIVFIIIIIVVIEFPYTNFNGKLKIHFIDIGQR